ncbi:MAG: di-heme oxidoredictase family protein [Bradymonadaceae bacterium]
MRSTPARWGAAAAIVVPLLLASVGCGNTDNGGGSSGPGIAEGIFGEMGGPMARATPEQRELFRKGKEVALHRFTREEGLGPGFNIQACGECHEAPVIGGGSPRYRNFWLMAKNQSNGSQNALAKKGVQRQYSVKPPYRRDTPKEADVVATRNAIPFFGVGATVEIRTEEIVKRADPEDADDDGISGRANREAAQGVDVVGRFGVKAQVASLEGFIRAPANNHQGITSDPLSPEMRDKLPADIPQTETPDEQPPTVSNAKGPLTGHGVCPGCQVGPPDEPLKDDDGVPDPEMTEKELFQLLSFVQLLAAPRPEEPTEKTRRGKRVFKDIGCDGCHVPSLKGPRGKVPAYTDLLLHDMGPKLADGFKKFMGSATGSEFRTQPLWGVAATGPYLHDGRADTIDGAIRWHGGEAKASKEKYVALSEKDRSALVAFLKSLGGADKATDGLIPPDQKPPEAGELEGPKRELSDSERAKFRAGRRVFDRNIHLDEGLGPNFNGDSCRACHFSPTPGGAGPAGVSVTRQGHFDADAEDEFEAPPDGTMLHKFSTDTASRPEAWSQTNVYELRNPPPLYGLGLVDEIPESELRANVDPMDMNGDGVSGRVAEPFEDRVGKFGWKGDFPTLEDFIRDAATNEMGMTVPDSDQFVAGRSSDSDDADDPEIGTARLESLVFYCKMLAPPPRRRTSGPKLEAGRMLFEEVGCADCHTPTLQTADGKDVHLYSDLLLHDVMSSDYRGVEGKDAKVGEFRTPPLWGISRTGPYMHDGLSGTIDDAIRRHADEAKKAADRYRALSDGEREQLMTFLKSL